MFYLSLIEHKFCLPPRLLGLPLDEAIKVKLEAFFLDKVIANLGLCISIYDIRSINSGFIMPGDGASTYTVEFRMVMFRPFVGECITTKLKESDQNGLRLSLGFFDDIYIPDHLMGETKFQADANNSNKGMWIWTYGEKEFPINGEDPIRFRVQHVSYPSIPLEQAENAKPFAPMVITGTFGEMDGLGAVSWWEGDEEQP